MLFELRKQTQRKEKERERRNLVGLGRMHHHSEHILVDQLKVLFPSESIHNKNLQVKKQFMHLLQLIKCTNW